MILLKLQGGLGNQMFQLAFGYTISKYTNKKIKFDLSRLLDRTEIPGHTHRNYDLDIFPLINIESIPIKKWKWEENFTGFTFIKEPRYVDYNEHRNFFNNLTNRIKNISLEKLIYIDGHWQKEYLFQEYSKEIKTIFRKIKIDNDSNFINMLIDINNHKGQTCMINVRRGDYLNNYQTFFAEVPISYYENSIEYFSKSGVTKFYVFSDDIEWCKKNLNIPYEHVFVSHLCAGNKFANYFKLMISCDHFIIPNSTFAWWAAYLGEHPDKQVIAPTKWFYDENIYDFGLIPNDWKLIEN